MPPCCGTCFASPTCGCLCHAAQRVGLSHCSLFVMLSACQASAVGHCAGQEAAAGPSPTPGAHACQGPPSSSKASSRSSPCAVCPAPVAPRGLQSPSAQKLTGDHRQAAQHQPRSTVSAPAELEHQQVEHPTGAQQLPQDQRFSAAAVEACRLESAAGCPAASEQAAAEAATAGSTTWPLHSSAADTQGSWGASPAATLQRLPFQWQLAADAAHRQGPACLSSGHASGDRQPTWSHGSSTCAASTRLEVAELWQACLAARQPQAGPACEGAQALQGEPGAQQRLQTVPLSNLLDTTSTAADLLSTQHSRHPPLTSPSQDGAPQQAPASQQDEGKCDTACSHMSWREAQSSVRPADVARDSSGCSLTQRDLMEEQAACSSEDDSSSCFVQPSEGESVCCVQTSALTTQASTHAGVMACRVPRCHLEHRQPIAVLCPVAI